MAYCEHGYPCANSACLLRLQAAGIPLPGQQESLLVQSFIRNPPSTAPFPGNNAQSPLRQHEGPPPNYPQPQGPPPIPGRASPQPPIYFCSQPIAIPPRPPPPSYPLNTYYHPNLYMRYAAHGSEHAQPPSGLHLPPWIGNNQSGPARYPGFTAPMAIVGPPAPMPLGGYTPGSQHPQSVTASHPSNRPDPRPDPDRPVQMACGGWYLPNERPGVPHVWLRGGGNDRDDRSEPEEPDTGGRDVEEDLEEDTGGRDVEEDVEEDAGAHKCLHCGQISRKALTGLRLSPSVLDFNQDGWLSRQDRASSEEDLRPAAQLQPLRPEHVMVLKEPESTDTGNDPRSDSASLWQSAGNLPTNVVAERHSSHHSSPIGKPLLSQSQGSNVSIADQSTVKKEHKAASGLGDPTSPTQCHVSVAPGPSPVDELRGQRSGVQRAPSGGNSRREGSVADPSTPPAASYQPRIPPIRVLYLSQGGRLYTRVKQHVSDPRQRAFNTSGLNYTPFTNHICAHEDQISPTVLEHLGISYGFHEQNAHWIIIRIDVTNELLRELLDRTRIKRNYAGPCSGGLVGSENSDSPEGKALVPGSVDAELSWATVLKPTPAEASGIRGGAGRSAARSRAIDLQPRWNTSGSRRVYRLSRTGQLTFGGKPVTDADYAISALPICINADRRDLLLRILHQEGLSWSPLADNRIQIDGYISPGVLRELIQKSQLVDSREAEDTEEPEEPEEPEEAEKREEADEVEELPSSGTDRHNSSPKRSTDTQNKGNTEARIRGGASGPSELRDKLDKPSQAYPDVYEGIKQSDASHTRILDLIINRSIRDEDRHLINLESLRTLSEAYDIRVHQHTISPLILAELEIPHYYDSADPDYSIITGSIPVDLIEIFIQETRLRFRHVAHHAAVEAQRQRELKNQNSDGSWFEERATGTGEQRLEDEDVAPRPHVNLRGGASSPEHSELLSPLSPRRRPSERPHEYNLRRLQHSRLRANEDEGSELTPTSDTETDQPETGPDPLRDSLNDFTRHRRNAADFSSARPWVPEQEAAQMHRNAPRHDCGPNGLTNAAHTESGDSTKDENAPFPLQPHGQQAVLWDAVLFTIPEGGRLSVTRENADVLFAWQVFDAAGNEVEGGERYNSRTVNGDAGRRAREGIPGVIFAEEGAGGDFVATHAVIGLNGREELRRRGTPVDRSEGREGNY